jgi:hypothetical protein
LNTQNKTPQLEVDLEELLADWQTRLRLLDWDISCEWATHYNVEAFGRTKTSLANRTALIDLVPPDQIDDEGILNDLEVTLVHELLHVKAADVLENKTCSSHPDLEGPLWECFIDQVAQALVAGKRGLQRLR